MLVTRPMMRNVWHCCKFVGEVEVPSPCSTCPGPHMQCALLLRGLRVKFERNDSQQGRARQVDGIQLGEPCVTSQRHNPCTVMAGS
jgi:hypothetical protein